MKAIDQPEGDGDMPPEERVTEEVIRAQDVGIDAALGPAETEGVSRDSRECGAPALSGGGYGLLLSSPDPAPEEGLPPAGRGSGCFAQAPRPS